MGNVSLKVLEFFVQKRVQNLLTIPTSQNKSEPTMVSATPRNTRMVVLEELRIRVNKTTSPPGLWAKFGQT